MAERTTMVQDTQKQLLAKESREIGTAARLTDHAGSWRKGIPKPSGEKIAEMRAANAGKNPTLSHKFDMADRTTNLKGNPAPLLAGKARTDDAREAKNGKNQGPAPPELSRNDVANKKRKQTNAVGCGAARMERSRAQGKPPPKRGDVTKRVWREMGVDVVAGVKKVIDTGKAFCCAPEWFDVDAFLEDLPSPTRREPMATLWDEVLV